MRYGLTFARHSVHCGVLHGRWASNGAGGTSVRLARSLTVEQTAIYDVRPPVRPADTRGDGLEVLAWVDRPEYTYARRRRSACLRRDQQGRPTSPSSTSTRPARRRSCSPIATSPTTGLRPVERSKCLTRLRGSASSSAERLAPSCSRSSPRPSPALRSRLSKWLAPAPFQVVRAQAARLARSLTVVMSDSNDAPSAGGAPVVRPIAGAVVRPARPSSPSPASPLPAGRCDSGHRIGRMGCVRSSDHDRTEPVGQRTAHP